MLHYLSLNCFLNNLERWFLFFPLKLKLSKRLKTHCIQRIKSRLIFVSWSLFITILLTTLSGLTSRTSFCSKIKLIFKKSLTSTMNNKSLWNKLKTLISSHKMTISQIISKRKTSYFDHHLKTQTKIRVKSLKRSRVPRLLTFKSIQHLETE